MMAVAVPPSAPTKPASAGQTTPSEFDASEGPTNAGGYRSPYTLAFHWSTSELLPDAGTAPRYDPKLSSAKPHEQWYTTETRKKDAEWGPQVRAFDVPACCKD